eukprot:2103195-Prymnesium_polylepis.1
MAAMVGSELAAATARVAAIAQPAAVTATPVVLIAVATASRLGRSASSSSQYLCVCGRRWVR